MDPYVKRVTACPTDPKTGHYEANAFIRQYGKADMPRIPSMSKVISIMTSYDLYKYNSMSVGDVGTGASRPSNHPDPEREDLPIRVRI